MGGVDRSGATLNIAEHLLDWRPGIPKHIVVGANFMYRRELENFLSRANHPDFITHQDLPSLAQLLFEGDVGFTAGGNTLYELACVGTPALVLYEDPHEMEQGLEFQKKGFGICLGSGVEVTKSQIWGALAKLEKPELRAMFCRRGRSVVDGKGAERVLASLLALASYDSSFQTFP
jgi:spore coat polysaccharide biosynthesis predicted glycosyltransferase SpsG|tara:strand:+ start:349 stop:876 length:528 start_codon:yes stop_codon:yes gene_type:complete